MWWRTDRLARTLPLVLIACSAAHFAAAQPRRLLAELGRMDPLPYAAPLVHAAEASDVFDDAIAAYGRRAFDDAAGLLRRVVAVDPDDQAANFFLAVSLMMTDEVGEAEDRLDAAERDLLVVIKSDSPYAQPAADLLPKVRRAKARR